MNIQIFGTKKCNDTKKAQCYFNPKGTEAWADEFETIDAVEIYINDAEIVDILRPMEVPYVIAENNELELAGAYGHLTSKELYSNLCNEH